MFKVLLAPSNSPMDTPSYFEDLPYPLLVSPKIDGIRAVPMSNRLLSRTLKPFRSIQAQTMFGQLDHLDGELAVGNPYDYDVYRRTNSHVMSFDKPSDDLRYYVFDTTVPDLLGASFEERLCIAEELVKYYANPAVHFIRHRLVNNYDELIAFENEALATGYEGIMMRTPSGVYKHNARCTWKDQIIFKLKRFADDEALILEVIEGEDNNNEQERDERGYAKRSDKKDGKTPSGMMGKWRVSYKGDDNTEVAPGCLSHKERVYILQHPEEFVGKYVKLRHFPKGVKDKPRFPRTIGFRDPIDMGE